MLRVRLLHWNAGEALPVRALLSDAGFRVEYELEFSSALIREWRANPPDAFVIDLSRLPSQGKEIGIAIRQSPKTRGVPLVFCGGVAEKVAAIRVVLPDADYCGMEGLVAALKAARPPKLGVRPVAMMDRFGHRTAAQKLGILAGIRVAVFAPPGNLHQVLGVLPDGVDFTEDDAAVTLCFVHSLDGLRAGLSQMRDLAGASKVWILWRKKSAIGHAGVTDGVVRETGLSLGLVDYKVCSVDETWSGMLFAKKKG